MGHPSNGCARPGLDRSRADVSALVDQERRTGGLICALRHETEGVFLRLLLRASAPCRRGWCDARSCAFGSEAQAPRSPALASMPTTALLLRRIPAKASRSLRPGLRCRCVLSRVLPQRAMLGARGRRLTGPATACNARGRRLTGPATACNAGRTWPPPRPRSSSCTASSSWSGRAGQSPSPATTWWQGL